jgi:hypothetical protein
VYPKPPGLQSFSREEMFYGADNVEEKPRGGLVAAVVWSAGVFRWSYLDAVRQHSGAMVNDLRTCREHHSTGSGHALPEANPLPQPEREWQSIGYSTPHFRNCWYFLMYSAAIPR